jgi:PIN like domain
MSDAKKPFPDPLVRQRLFPEATKVFEFIPEPIEEVLRKGAIVLDTNVLLVPYTTGRASLEQIRQTYSHLVSEDRLRIPGQVAREFADNRSEKLKTLFQQLSRKREVNLARSEYPLLEGISAYSELVKQESEIFSALTNYRKLIGNLLDIVAGWHWNDPVSEIYRGLFKPPIVVDPQFDREELLSDLKYRQEHRIPPGFKDGNNEYSGVGDLIIWKTLLAIGQQETRHIIFVSGDEKTDWRYQSEGRALYPRFELLDEYRRASGGKSLSIISFAELLEQLGAPAPIVAEVKQEEAVASLAEPSVQKTTQQKSHNGFRAERAVLRWLKALYPAGEFLLYENQAPDFVIREAGRIEGYEVKYLGSSLESQRIPKIIRFTQGLSEIKLMPINLVVVLDANVPPFVMMRLFGMLRVTRLPDMIPRIVLGILNDDGSFEEHHTIRSGDFTG